MQLLVDSPVVHLTSNHLIHISFLNVVDLLNVGLSEVKDRQIWMDRYLPSIWNNTVCQTLRMVVKVGAVKLFDAPGTRL